MDIKDFYTDDDYEYVGECSTLQLNGFPSQVQVTGFHPTHSDVARIFTRERIVFDRENEMTHAVYYSEPSPRFNQSSVRLTIFND